MPLQRWDSDDSSEGEVAGGLQRYSARPGSSSSDDESDSDHKGGTGTISLSVTRMESLHAVATEIDKTSDKDIANRLKAVLRDGPCECQCRVPVPALIRINRTFWNLSKAAQDSILWIAPKSLLEKSDQQLREDLLNKLVDSRLMGPTAQLCFGHDPKQLPMRELPHGCYWNVYMMYTAYCRMMGEEPAGKSLFYSTVRAWDSCLKFHKKTDFQQVIKWSDMLLSHYTVQWRDRQTYWMARQRAVVSKQNLGEHIFTSFPDPERLLDTDLSSVLKAAEDGFNWQRINFVLEIRGDSVEKFIAQAQDRTKNALHSSMVAAYNAWEEQLECHEKAWSVVTSYLDSNLHVFWAKTEQAESVVIPQITTWVQESLGDIPECRSADDHSIVAWLCLPTCGIVSAAKHSFFLTFIANFLAQHRRNGLVLIVHANRDAAEDADVRDVRTDLAQKDRNLSVRSVTWIFAPEEVSDGKRMLCGTVVLDASDQITQRVANTLYDKCRSKALSLPQFPDFQPLLQALKQGDSASVSRQYNVCVQAQDRLVILESFASKFVNSEITKDKCEQAITNHNEKYNTGGEYWAQETRSGESAPEPPTKKIKIEPTDMFKESDVSSLQHPHKLSINNAAELLTDGTGELLYLISRGKNTFNQHRELFSFGSGEWREASEADEVMQGTSGRWYPFVVSTETLLCLEKQGLPEHLQQLPSIESPVAVSSLLAEMEDSGEASGICEKGFYCGPPF
ncbi:unnamed protein product [Durusdinium trenchii]|uniref:Uncharacterized protein n=1 Tax=Durusdinium trenchii TaxID=1381693 RepID=A0ABP0M6H8_9DINO